MKQETTVEPMAEAVVEVNGTEKVLDLNAGRRAFLRSAAVATAASIGAAGGVTALTSGTAAAQEDGNIDIAILNFALNLEYLEAEFYLRATRDEGLPDGLTTGTGRRGGVSGGRRVPFRTKAIRLYAEEVAEDEFRHVAFLREALGGAAVARPRIDLGLSFRAAARAAGLVTSDDDEDQFDPYANENNFLLSAFIFEDVGVTAYKGAAPLITDRAILSAAAGILAVEAYHAGEIRTTLYRRGLFSEARAISNLRDRVDGDSDLDQPIGNPNFANIVPADRNALAFGRTPQQVLPIVYLGGEDRGGFFPLGLNGTFA